MSFFFCFCFCLLWRQMLCKKSWFRQEQQLVRHAGNRSISHCEPQRLAQSDTSVQAFTGPGLEDDIIQWADTAQPAHTVRQSSKCCPPPRSCFVFWRPFFSWRNAPVWPQQRRRVCCCKISDQRNGSGRNVIRPVVVNPFARRWQVPAYASCTPFYRCWIPEMFISIWDFISKSY